MVGARADVAPAPVARPTNGPSGLLVEGGSTEQAGLVDDRYREPLRHGLLGVTS